VIRDDQIKNESSLLDKKQIESNVEKNKENISSELIGINETLRSNVNGQPQISYIDMVELLEKNKVDKFF
jgi:hypothetical protein